MKTERRKRRAKVIPTNPKWEAAKASGRNLDHNDAVQESALLQKQYRALWSSKVASSPVDLNEILRTLSQKKIPFVLTGAHGGEAVPQQGSCSGRMKSVRKGKEERP